jgi:hypothetical protein
MCKFVSTNHTYDGVGKLRLIRCAVVILFLLQPVL